MQNCLRLSACSSLVVVLLASPAASQFVWKKLSPKTNPEARTYHMMVYDVARARTVLFGGEAVGTDPQLSGRRLADTWTWDRRDWRFENPLDSPPARSQATMVYDSIRRLTVLFGGRSATNEYLNDTWEWDGVTWTERKPKTSPPPRTWHSMAYDQKRGRTVVFGGHFEDSSKKVTKYDDTWEWDGTNWKKMATTTAPSPRSGSGLTYDAGRGITLLFSGWLGSNSQTACTLYNDTWTWDGVKWTELAPQTRPSLRDDFPAAFVYDRRRDRVVFHGGNTCASSFRDTWEWDGTNWKLVGALPIIGKRTAHGMVFDKLSGRCLLFGGGSGTGSSWYKPRHNDTWELGESSSPLEADVSSISLKTGGVQNLELNAGIRFKNKSYVMCGSVLTDPGVTVNGQYVPLVPDFYTSIVLSRPQMYTGFMGTFSATGTSTAKITLPRLVGIPAGLKLYHAYMIFDSTGTILASSNAVSLATR